MKPSQLETRLLFDLRQAKKLLAKLPLVRAKNIVKQVFGPLAQEDFVMVKQAPPIYPMNQRIKIKLEDGWYTGKVIQSAMSKTNCAHSIMLDGTGRGIRVDPRLLVPIEDEN